MNNQIQEMIGNGFANKRIAKFLNLSEKYVKTIAKDNNFLLNKEDFSEEKIEHICELYRQGVSAKSLALKYSIDKRRIQKWAKSKGFLRDKSLSNRFTHFNQNIFDNIDSIEKAYWLGFLYADCYNSESVSTVSLTLAAKDFDHIVKFAKFLNYPINEVFYGEIDLEGKKYPTSNIKLYSKYLCKVLHDHGCPQAKSLILKYPNWINKDLQKHFVLGYFDGDGSIKMNLKKREWKLNFCGTYDMLNGIKGLISEQNIYGNVSSHSKTGNNTYVMDTNGNEQVHRFCEYLYKDAIVYLERKYLRFLKLKDRQENRKISKTRDNYIIKDDIKKLILSDILVENSDSVIAKKYNVNRITVKRLRDKR